MTELLALHAPDDLVAFGAKGSRTRRDLLADAARVAAALPEPTDGSHVLLVFQHDRYLLAVALLAAFARGHAVTLPPNTRRDTIFELSERPETVAILHDTEAGIAIKIEPLLEGAADVAPLEAAGIPSREIIATLFTSGTTRAMTAWPKTAGQLLGEAAMLGETFAIERGAKIVATVSPGHIYGLLYTVLLPLLRGAAFLRETPLHAEAIAARVEAHAADVLVTVPAHLRSFEAVAPESFRSLSRVFASTAPLPEAHAEAFLARFGLPVTEVLGSTETGGIAHRERRPGTRFAPLRGVAVSVDHEGRLLVDSPYADARVERPFRTADLVALDDDGAFTHLGRADGVVKVGGKRVSLPALEDAIRAVPGVRDAAVLSVDGGAGRGAQILAAVAADESLAQAIRAALLDRFDPSCLPRRTVFVEALPREENGKLTRGAALRLFGLTPDERPIVWTVAPCFTESTREGAKLRHRLRFGIPETLGYFDGHFVGYPILPGAAQLTELVVEPLRSLHPELGAVKAFSKLKFLGRITPGDEIEVRLEVAAAGATFEIRKGEELCTAGAVAFHGVGR
ncbi:MAG: AMP-binding protein [Myxococcales bacterium]|nr:AMP-binding protein [Myxococcales bacterium]